MPPGSSPLWTVGAIIGVFFIVLEVLNLFKKEKDPDMANKSWDGMVIMLLLLALLIASGTK